MEGHIGIDLITEPRAPNADSIECAGNFAEEIITDNLGRIGAHIEAQARGVRRLKEFHARIIVVIAVRCGRAVIDEEGEIEADHSSKHARVVQILPIGDRAGAGHVAEYGIVKVMVGGGFPAELGNVTGGGLGRDRKPINHRVVGRTFLAERPLGIEVVEPNLVLGRDGTRGGIIK